MNWITVKSQIEFDAAIAADKDGWFDIVAGTIKAIIYGGLPRLRISAAASVRVEAWGSSQPHVEAWGSSQPHVVARESSQPHVEARESSQPHVVARESSQPHVEASGYVQLSIAGRVKVGASARVSIAQRGATAIVDGGNVTVIDLSTAAAWCDYYGVAVADGVATLFKAVDDDFSTERARRVGISYAPGHIPVAPDWDGGERECGGGLHASPHPVMALEFNGSAKHFVACLVNLTDIAVHPNGDIPQKVKFRGCCAPCFEVDRSGKPITAQVEAA